MQNAMIGWQNALAAAQITAPDAYSNFPASNLALDVGGNTYGWRAPASGTRGFGASFSATSVRVFSWHRSNFMPSATGRLYLYLSNNTVYDSGVIPLNVVNGQAVFVLPAPVVADSLLALVTDAAQPQSYLTAGFAYVGPVFQPARNFTMDAGWGSTPQVDGFTSRNGLAFPQYRYRKRTLKLPWGNFLPSEMPTVEAIIAYADTARNLLVVPQPDTLTGGLLPLFGQASAADRGLVQGGYRSTVLTVTERL